MSVERCVHYFERKSVQAKETDTIGENQYLVALAVGGLMEMPEIEYRDYQIINADTAKEAVEKYNDINKCSYFYGHCIGQVAPDGRVIRLDQFG